MKKYAISNYYDNIEQNLAEASKNNSKLFWKLLKDAFNVKSSTVIPPLVYYPDNRAQSIAFSNEEKVEALNNYFSSISCIDDSGANLPDMYFLCNNVIDSIFITEEDIIDIITTIPTNKAIGPDNISHKMLKNTVSTIVKPLCLLFNRSLKDFYFQIHGKLQMFYHYLRKVIHQNCQTTDLCHY